MLPPKVVSFWNNPDLRTRKMNRNIIRSLLVKGAGILISLLLVPMTLHYLRAYEYGVWVTLWSVVMWINYFDIGLGNGMRNKLAEAVASGDSVLGKEYVSTTFFMLSLISAAVCCIFLAAAPWIDWNGLFNAGGKVPTLNAAVGVTMVCMFVNFTLRLVGVIHQSYQNAWINDLMTMLGSLLSFVWIFILTLTSEASLLKVSVAYSVSPLIVYILAMPLTFRGRYRDVAPSMRFVRRCHFASLGVLGVKFFILQMACLVIFSTSNVLISRWFSPEEVTPYSIVYRYYNVLSMVFGIVLVPMWTAVTDAYSRKDIGWIRVTMCKLTAIWGIFTACAILMTVFAIPVIRLWVGAGTVIPMAICIAVGVYTVVYMLSILISSYCNGTGHLGMAVWSMVTAAVIFVPCAWALSKVAGVSGVAWAMALVLVLPTVCMYIQYFSDIKKIESDGIAK